MQARHHTSSDLIEALDKASRQSGRILSRRSLVKGLGALGALALFGLSGCGEWKTGAATSANDYNATPNAERELVTLEVDNHAIYSLDSSHVSPDPSSAEGTVLTASISLDRRQRFFLWEEGNVPAVTKQTREGYYDPLGFRPTVTSVPALGDAKGAVILCAGGAFQVRADNSDCYPTAIDLTQRGYHCFVVDYRLEPFTQQEGALDLARAVRFVRAHAADYGLPNDRCIALGGFSAGGILCGEELMNWSGNVTPNALDPTYQPDELDQVSADAAAVAMIYSFYGRQSVASTDSEALRAASLPPTFYCYGTRDPFYDQFETQVKLMTDIGYRVHARVLDGWPHGFGALGEWESAFDAFVQEAFERA